MKIITHLPSFLTFLYFSVEGDNLLPIDVGSKYEQRVLNNIYTSSKNLTVSSAVIFSFELNTTRIKINYMQHCVMVIFIE